jgi:uncharacterized protein (DUF1778 family)
MNGSASALHPVDMWTTCSYADDVAKMIQLRHVPDDLHRTLKSRAALEGLSLSDFLLREVRRIAERPTVDELRRRLAARTPAPRRINSARLIRAERAAVEVF